MKLKSSTLWLSLMVIAGFSSFIYELALAQLLTGLLGGAMLRFATTLGVYVVALGIGSVSFRPRDIDSNRQSFLSAELALFALGLSSPFLFVFFERMSLALLSEASAQTYFVLFSTHAIIFLMGFFCGREVPILSSIVDDEAEVLAADYLGMFLASLAFPFFLFPNFGLIPTFAVATILNLVAAIATAVYMPRSRRTFVLSIFVFAFALNSAVLVFSSELQTWLSRAFVSTS